MADTLATTPVQPPIDPPIDPAPPKRRRRWIAWTVFGLVVAVAAAAVTVTAIVANYQPLWGGGRAWPAPPGIGATITQEYWLQPNGFEQLPPQARYITIPAHKGLTFTYRFSFFNKGKTPITVTSIGLPASAQRSDGGLIITPVAVQTSRMAALGTWGPMQPFTLGEREMASVEMRVQVTECSDGGVVWNSFPVSFTVLGVHRHDRLPTNVEIYLSGQDKGC